MHYPFHETVDCSYKTAPVDIGIATVQTFYIEEITWWRVNIMLGWGIYAMHDASSLKFRQVTRCHDIFSHFPMYKITFILKKTQLIKGKSLFVLAAYWPDGTLETRPNKRDQPLIILIIRLYPSTRSSSRRTC